MSATGNAQAAKPCALSVSVSDTVSVMQAATIAGGPGGNLKGRVVTRTDTDDNLNSSDSDVEFIGDSSTLRGLEASMRVGATFPSFETFKLCLEQLDVLKVCVHASVCMYVLV